MNYFADKPGKPDVPEITQVAKTSCSLSWKPPKNDGGAEIFNYVVEYRIEGGFKWKRATESNISETRYTVKGLKTEQIYEFHVGAENKAGVGPMSDPTSPVEAKEVIGRVYVSFSP